MILPKMQQDSRIAKKMSTIDVQNKKNQEREEIYFARDGFRNVLDYCDYSRLCCVIT